MYLKYKPNQTKPNIKALIKSAHRSIWDREWSEYKEAKHTKHFYPASNEKRAKEAIKLPRLELARLVKLVTDHGDLAYFYSKLEPNSNPLCRFCRERNETFLHLTECPRLRTYQNECFAGNTVNHTWKISRILEFSYKKKLNALIDGYDCNVSNISIFTEASSEDSFIFSQPEPD